MKRKLLMTLAVFLVIGLFIAGCGVSDDTKIQQEQGVFEHGISGSTGGNTKSLQEQFEQDMLWEKENFYVSQEDMQRHIESKYWIGRLTNSTLRVTGVESFSAILNPGFVTRSGQPNSTELCFYVFTLERDENDRKGYALTCGDLRSNLVYQFIPYGSFDKDRFISGVQNTLREKIIEYNEDYKYWTSFERWNRGDLFGEQAY